MQKIQKQGYDDTADGPPAGEESSMDWICTVIVDLCTLARSDNGLIVSMPTV